MNALDEFKAAGNTHLSDDSNSEIHSPDPRLAFLSRRGLSKLEKVTAKRDMPARDPVWAVLKGSSKKTNLYKHDGPAVRLWANVLNSILTHVASMFILSKSIHTKLMKADKLLPRKTQGDAYNILIAYALRKKLLAEVHSYSKEGEKRRARLLRVIDPVLRADLARMAGGEDKLLDDEREIRVAYDKRVELEAEKAKSQVAKAVGDGHVPPVAPSSTKKVGGPARISEADRAMFREIEPFKWRDLALDRDARVPKMRELVQFLLRRFDADDFNEITFKEMAHCFVSEEVGPRADEKNWAGLVKALDSLARKEFKAETGRTPPKPTLAKEPLQVYEGELLGTDEP